MNDAAVTAQIRAADPAASSWVSANAGTGKTRVLTDRVARLQAGECPILEQGLPELLAEGSAAGRLRFTTDNLASAAAEYVYLCVPTPQRDDGAADLSFIESVAGEIGPALVPGTVVVNKSTVPVGSTVVVERALGRSDVLVSLVAKPGLKEIQPSVTEEYEIAWDGERVEKQAGFNNEIVSAVTMSLDLSRSDGLAVTPVTEGGGDAEPVAITPQ